MELHTDRTPGSFIEEKEYSLSWHYRRCDPDLAATRLSELKETLMELTANLNIGLLDGNKVIEVKNTNITKGKGAGAWLGNNEFDFSIAIGDDWTDEDLFKVMPDNAITIKVGPGATAAKYRMDSVDDVRSFLKDISNR